MAQFNTPKNETSLKARLVSGVFWSVYSRENTEFEFEKTKVFSVLKLEKGVDYSYIQYFVWACHFVSVTDIERTFLFSSLICFSCKGLDVKSK